MRVEEPRPRMYAIWAALGARRSLQENLWPGLWISWDRRLPNYNRKGI